MTVRRWEDGQATVELALVLPVVIVLALAVVQVAVVAHRQLLVVHAAREAARAAAVADDDRAGAARRAAVGAGGLDPARLRVETDVAGGRVRCVVVLTEPTDVVLVGALLPPVSLEAAATMRVEGSGPERG